MTGRVVSTKTKETAIVIVERIAKHPVYNKSFIRSKKYTVHDTLGVGEGDVVNFEKCRPISKNKHWTVIKVVGKNLTEINEEKLKVEAQEVIAEVMPEEDKKTAAEVSGEVEQQEVLVKKVTAIKQSKGKESKLSKKK